MTTQSSGREEERANAERIERAKVLGGWPFVLPTLTERERERIDSEQSWIARGGAVVSVKGGPKQVVASIEEAVKLMQDAQKRKGDEK